MPPKESSSNSTPVGVAWCNACEKEHSALTVYRHEKRVKKRKKQASNDSNEYDDMPGLAPIANYPLLGLGTSLLPICLHIPPTPVTQPTPQNSYHVPHSSSSVHHSDLDLSTCGKISEAPAQIETTISLDPIPIICDDAPALTNDLGSPILPAEVPPPGPPVFADSEWLDDGDGPEGAQASDDTSTRSTSSETNRSPSPAGVSAKVDEMDEPRVDVLLLEAINTVQLYNSLTLDEAVKLNAARQALNIDLQSDNTATFDAIKAFRLQMETNLGANAFAKLRLTFPSLPFPSLKVIQSWMADLSGLETTTLDCCRNSCICFTGRYADAFTCPVCNTPRKTANGSAANQFVYVKLIPQLQALYASPESAHRMWYRSKTADPTSMKPNSIIDDIYDSQHYRTLCDTFVSLGTDTLPHKFFSDPCDILLLGMTDGFQVFKRGKHTAWPIALVNGNLDPTTHRYHIANMILVGLIPGPNMPKDFDSFLEVFIEELEQLAVGVRSYDAVDDAMFDLHAYMPFGLGDIPAISKAFMKMKGTNAKVPCRACKIPATRNTAIRGASTYYLPLQCPPGPDYPPLPFGPSSLPLRTHYSFVQEARDVDLAPTTAEKDRCATVCGINGSPASLRIPGISIPDSFPFNFMHLISNGLKNYLKIFSGDFKNLNAGSENYIIPKTTWKEIAIATTSANSTIPAAFGRAIPDLSEHLAYFTCEALLVWSTLYAPVLLRDRFTKRIYYDHFMRFVSIIERCMVFSSTSSEREALRADIVTWYNEYEMLFYQYTADRLPFCVLTFHAWLHIVDTIERSGPLWSLWCWIMERVCGKLARAVSSRKHPYSSLNRRIIETQSLKMISTRFSLQHQLPNYTHTPHHDFSVPGYDVYCVWPRCPLALDQNPETRALRRRIATFVARRYGIPQVDALNLVLEAITQWGKLRLGAKGDLVRSAVIKQDAELGFRNASFIEYDDDVDVKQHLRNAPPQIEAWDFYGQMQQFLVCTLLPDSRIKPICPLPNATTEAITSPPTCATEATASAPTQVVTLVLADVLRAMGAPDPAYGLYEYRELRNAQIIDASRIHCLIGRIQDRGKWVVVTRGAIGNHERYSTNHDMDEIVE